MQTQTTSTAAMTEAANTPWDHAQAQSTVMARVEAATMVTAAERYAAGLARLDAAVRAGCGKCGGPVERIGVDMVECQEPGCFFCQSTEASH